MHRARAALQRARLARGLGGVRTLRASEASLPPRARLSTPVLVPGALSAALPHAWRGLASSGAWTRSPHVEAAAKRRHVLMCLASLRRAGVQGPPGADVTPATVQQHLADVAAQLRAVDAEIKAAHAAGDAHEVEALREKQLLLMEKEILLLRLHVSYGALQPGACLLLLLAFRLAAHQLSRRDSRPACGSLR
jgi:hypothetical protein